MLVFPLISFDFLNKTKESACQALLSNWRGIPYVGGGTSDAGDWDIYIYVPGLAGPPPPPRHPMQPPPTPPVGWGVGWGSHALLLIFILGLQQNIAFGSIWQHSVAQTCSKQGHGSFHGQFCFDFV